MDVQFSSKLQIHMALLGKKEGLADFRPPKSQDPADKVLHEYFVAETGRSLFDKRRKAALEELKRLDQTGIVPRVIKMAEEGNTSNTAIADTENYTASVATKNPVKSVDVTLLTNTLIKLGVDQTTINKALVAATVAAKPACTYTVSTKSS